MGATNLGTRAARLIAAVPAATGHRVRVAQRIAIEAATTGPAVSTVTTVGVPIGPPATARVVTAQPRRLGGPARIAVPRFVGQQIVVLLIVEPPIGEVTTGEPQIVVPPLAEPRIAGFRIGADLTVVLLIGPDLTVAVLIGLGLTAVVRTGLSQTVARLTVAGSTGRDPTGAARTARVLGALVPAARARAATRAPDPYGGKGFAIRVTRPLATRAPIGAEMTAVALLAAATLGVATLAGGIVVQLIGPAIAAATGRGTARSRRARNAAGSVLGPLGTLGPPSRAVVRVRAVGLATAGLVPPAGSRTATGTVSHAGIARHRVMASGHSVLTVSVHVELRVSVPNALTVSGHSASVRSGPSASTPTARSVRMPNGPSVLTPNGRSDLTLSVHVGLRVRLHVGLTVTGRSASGPSVRSAMTPTVHSVRMPTVLSVMTPTVHSGRTPSVLSALTPTVHVVSTVTGLRVSALSGRSARAPTVRNAQPPSGPSALSGSSRPVVRMRRSSSRVCGKATAPCFPRISTRECSTMRSASSCGRWLVGWPSRSHCAWSRPASSSTQTPRRR